jgi:hypothetical protein
VEKSWDEKIEEMRNDSKNQYVKDSVQNITPSIVRDIETVRQQVCGRLASHVPSALSPSHPLLSADCRHARGCAASDGAQTDRREGAQAQAI